MADHDVAILMYHEVLPDDGLAAVDGLIQSGYVLPQSVFREQLEMMAERGYQTPSLSDFVGWMTGRNSLPPKSVVITFDDGFAGNFEYALPMLEKLGFRAVFFVATNRIGDPAMMTWSQLAMAASRGIEVQSHTASHPLLSQLTPEQTMAEFVESREAIERHLGQRPKALSLPNGDTNPWYREIARETGYVAVFGSQFGRNTRSQDLYSLRRIAVRRGMSSQRLGDMLEGESAAYRYGLAVASCKRAFVRLVGKGRYDRFYNAVFGVSAQQRGSPS
jgi:peptidoglycan/xylan/chitin deacetylase (PgdA/CDA1 family)